MHCRERSRSDSATAGHDQHAQQSNDREHSAVHGPFRLARHETPRQDDMVSDSLTRSRWVRQPSQGAQAGNEAILAAPGHDELRYPLEPQPKRTPRDVVRPVAFAQAADRVLGGASTEEVSLV